MILGDSLRLLPTLLSESVDLIVTDPPYAIGYRSNRRVARPKFDFIAGDRPGDWIALFARESFRVLRPNRLLYCFCRHDTYPLFFNAFREAGFRMKRTLIWIKNNHGSGDLRGDWAPKDEWIVFASKGRRLLNPPRETNIITCDKVASVELLHPTQKPVMLLRKLIEKSSQEREVVCDPFAGVLSTALAAMDLRRGFVMMDSSREFIEAGMRRLDEHPRRGEYEIAGG